MNLTTRFSSRLIPLLVLLLALLSAGGVAPAFAATSGTVVAWGWNPYGQTTVPAGLSNVTAIAAGGYHSLALKSDGTVVAWGSSGDGRANVPAELSGVTTAIAGGGSHSLALKSDGTVVAWGWNPYGQTTVPEGLSNVTAIAGGAHHSLALKSDGTVVAWGYEATTVPEGLSNVTTIAAGGIHSLALKSDGSVVAWGSNSFGESTVPAGLSDVAAIAAGYQHSLALKDDGTVVAWGNNNDGRTTVPVGLSNVTAIAVGHSHNLALVDTTPPVITPNSAGTQGNNDLYTSDATVSWSVVDNESDIASQTGCELTTISTDTDGMTLTCSATSAGGTSSQSVTIKRDATAPAIECGSADSEWHADDVSIACTAADATSGLADAADASFDLTTSVANDTETDNASTGSRSVADAAGNSATAGPVAGNKIDKKAPSVSIVTPASTSYRLGQVVAADFSCSDGGSGVASCDGTVANGANLDTASVGAKTFTANTADTAGNTGSQTASYSVVYDFSGFFSPVANAPTMNTARAGGRIALKFSLAGNQGLDIFAANSPASQPIDCTSKATVGSATPTTPLGPSGLTYRARSDEYSYTWQTVRTWAGTCREFVMTLNDATQHVAHFNFTK